MTKKRYLAVFGILACIICIGLFVLTLLMSHRPGLSKANFDLVKKGMTKTEVKAILGDGNDFNAQNMIEPEANEENLDLLDDTKQFWLIDDMELWRNPDGSAATVLFVKGKVVFMGWGDSTETIVEKLRRWLHL